ncbi:hypothetical protein BGX31_000544 [Mortierella sp. GBA43]|nr:hypothetical protein BGX31_000544 [Mortierella sp. GBA43]
MALILPNVRHLSIEAAKSDTESWRLKYVLGHCSSALEVLTLGVNVIYTSEVKKREEATKESDEPKYWTSLRSLTLWYAGDGSCVHTFWSWLLKRCYHVERLEVMEIRDIIPALLVGIWKHMPYISEISLGRNSIETQDLTDDQVMSLLSVRHQGWKVIEIGYTARFGSKARQALAKHFPTLQVLAVDGSRDFTSKDLIWVLSSCPRLRILNVIDEDQYVRDTFIRFGAREFIDMDPFTGALNPWACESSLKELRVRITGIPRPDLQDNIAIEAYPDEGRRH